MKKWHTKKVSRLYETPWHKQPDLWKRMTSFEFLEGQAYNLFSRYKRLRKWAFLRCEPFMASKETILPSLRLRAHIAPLHHTPDREWWDVCQPHSRRPEHHQNLLTKKHTKHTFSHCPPNNNNNTSITSQWVNHHNKGESAITLPCPTTTATMSHQSTTQSYVVVKMMIHLLSLPLMIIWQQHRQQYSFKSLVSVVTNHNKTVVRVERTMTKKKTAVIIVNAEEEFHIHHHYHHHLTATTITIPIITIHHQKQVAHQMTAAAVMIVVRHSNNNNNGTLVHWFLSHHHHQEQQHPTHHHHLPQNITTTHHHHHHHQHHQRHIIMNVISCWFNQTRNILWKQPIMMH